MNTYRTTYTNNWNPYSIQHSTDQAESVEALVKMYNDTGATVTDIELADVSAEYAAALLSAYDADRVRNPKYPAGTYDPRTDAERELVQWQAEALATQESARP